MIGWLVLLGYVVGGVVAFRCVYTISWEYERQSRYQDRESSIMFASLAAIFGPVVPIGLLLWKCGLSLLVSPTKNERREAREKELQKELDDLKRAAKEYGLPW